MKKLFIASDHRGFSEKQRLIALLSQADFSPKLEVLDLGPSTLKPDDDYNDAAIAVARAVRETPESIGILICGSSHGMVIQSNRFRGIRAISGFSPELAQLGRKHNNANILCLSANLMPPNLVDAVVETFLKTDFLPEERLIRRNQRLDEEEIHA